MTTPRRSPGSTTGQHYWSASFKSATACPCPKTLHATTSPITSTTSPRSCVSGRQAAKMYVTDDVIGDMADRIATAVSRLESR